MISKKIRNDIILIAAVILIAAIAIVCMVFLKKDGKNAVVYVDGELYGKYPLNESVTVDIKSKNGTNRLVIADGKARITEASCPDLRCVEHNAISNDIEPIICLPNKVVISIE